MGPSLGLGWGAGEGGGGMAGVLVFRVGGGGVPGRPQVWCDRGSGVGGRSVVGLSWSWARGTGALLVEGVSGVLLGYRRIL